MWLVQRGQTWFAIFNFAVGEGGVKQGWRFTTGSLIVHQMMVAQLREIFGTLMFSKGELSCGYREWQCFDSSNFWLTRFQTPTANCCLLSSFGVVGFLHKPLLLDSSSSSKDCKMVFFFSSSLFYKVWPRVYTVSDNSKLPWEQVLTFLEVLHLQLGCIQADVTSHFLTPIGHQPHSVSPCSFGATAVGKCHKMMIRAWPCSFVDPLYTLVSIV